MVGFYNRDEECLLRGTDWVFKYSRLRFVFKGLMTSFTELSLNEEERTIGTH
jgi:hypothetical protein